MAFPGFDVVTSPPSRDAEGRFKFAAMESASKSEKSTVGSFRPNRSPAEVLRAGAFGGTYFRTIKSGVVHSTLEGAWKELPKEWIQGLVSSLVIAMVPQTMNSFLCHRLRQCTCPGHGTNTT